MCDKLKRHPLGFLQLKDLPSKEELEQYYVAKYYQQNKSSYQKSYSNAELKWIETRNPGQVGLFCLCSVLPQGTGLEPGPGEPRAIDPDPPAFRLDRSDPGRIR